MYILYLLSLKTVLTKERGRYFVPFPIIIRNIIAAHICERNAVMWNISIMQYIYYHYPQ